MFQIVLKEFKKIFWALENSSMLKRVLEESTNFWSRGLKNLKNTNSKYKVLKGYRSGKGSKTFQTILKRF
jgi:hypothetical protein